MANGRRIYAAKNNGYKSVWMMVLVGIEKCGRYGFVRICHTTFDGYGGSEYRLPYNPDLNPIELAFAKLEAHRRQAAARTLEELYSALATALGSLSAQHCQGFFRQRFETDKSVSGEGGCGCIDRK
jgi:transposase